MTNAHAAFWLFAPLVLGLVFPGSALAQATDPPSTERSTTPGYPTSPYHGVRDGDGRIIPCRCRSGGRDFRLGDQVCMQTAIGTVMARCDLQDNNTSWIPTGTPCEISRIQDRGGVLAALPRSTSASWR
jgi:hypothetical protein